jgi:hypothetical protein
MEPIEEGDPQPIRPCQEAEALLQQYHESVRAYRLAVLGLDASLPPYEFEAAYRRAEEGRAIFEQRREEMLKHAFLHGSRPRDVNEPGGPGLPVVSWRSMDDHKRETLEKLHRECIDALGKLLKEGEAMCRILSSIESHPASREQRRAIAEQRVKENAAHKAYDSARQELFNLAGWGS